MLRLDRTSEVVPEGRSVSDLESCRANPSEFQALLQLKLELLVKPETIWNELSDLPPYGCGAGIGGLACGGCGVKEGAEDGGGTAPPIAVNTNTNLNDDP